MMYLRLVGICVIVVAMRRAGGIDFGPGGVSGQSIACIDKRSLQPKDAEFEIDGGQA